jgi:hypothetical protein
MNEVKRLSHQVEEHEKSLSYAYQYRAEQDTEIERLRAAAQAVIDQPLLMDSCDEWRALREALARDKANCLLEIRPIRPISCGNRRRTD